MPRGAAILSNPEVATSPSRHTIQQQRDLFYLHGNQWFAMGILLLVKGMGKDLQFSEPSGLLR